MRKKVILPIVTAVLVVAAVLTVFLIPKDGTDKKLSAGEISQNGDVEIKLSDLSASKASIISYSADGTAMELLAVKGTDGNIDVAFNTCQVCNGSPRAYYVQANGILTCQNCGNTFPLSAIGMNGNGCNPITIGDEYMTKTEDGVVISKEFLDANKTLFRNWKKS